MDTNSPERARWNDSAATTRNREESKSFRKDLHGRKEAVAVKAHFSVAEHPVQVWALKMGARLREIRLHVRGDTQPRFHSSALTPAHMR